VRKEDIQIIRLGSERQPLVVLDNFVSDPDVLTEAANDVTYQHGGQFYPGVRATADPAWLQEQSGVLEQIFSQVFGVADGIDVTESNYSLVTTPENDLKPIQSLPHFDGFDPDRFALLLYLCPENMGGTAFYRHRSTGFETVTQDRFQAYKQALEQEAAIDGTPAGYYRDSERFKRIHTVEARVNRMVIYRGITLHSGDIPVNFKPTSDPSKGRLTINIFCQGM